MWLFRGKILLKTSHCQYPGMPVFRKFPDLRKFSKKFLDFRKFFALQKNRNMHFSRKFVSISGNFYHNDWYLCRYDFQLLSSDLGVFHAAGQW